MNYIEIKEEAKELTSKYIFSFWKGTLLVFASSLVLSIILAIVANGILAVITEILLLPLYIGLTSYILGITRKEDVSFTRIFSGYKKIGLIVVILIISYILCMFGYFIFIIPGIILTYSFAMISYLLADTKETNIDKTGCIVKQSMKMMNGYKMDYFTFQLSFIGWYFLGIITLGIAYIYVIPYFTFANTLYYQRLKEKLK